MSNEAYTPPAASVIGEKTGNHAVSHEMLDQLKRTRPWVTLIAVALFVLSVLMLLGSIGLFIGGSSLGMEKGLGGSEVVVGMGLTYILISLLFYLVPGILLIRYSTAIGQTLQTNSLQEVEVALNRQRSYCFGCYRISSCVSCSFYVVWKYISIFLARIKIQRDYFFIALIVNRVGLIALDRACSIGEGILLIALVRC